MDDLVLRARRGDPVAFDRILDRVLPEFHRLATLIVGPSDADDITQEAMVAVWRELPRLRDPTRFMPWARRTLVNRCRDGLRSRRRRLRTLEVATWPADEPRPGPASAGPGDTAGIPARLDLRRAVACLPPEQRVVVALHYAAGLTIAETADALGVPAGTAKSRLHAALEGLRRELGEGDA